MNVLQHTRNELNLCPKQNRPDRSYRDTLLTDFNTMDSQNPELKIFADFKLLVRKNHEFKIMAIFKMLESQNPEFNILADFRV